MRRSFESACTAACICRLGNSTAVTAPDAAIVEFRAVFTKDNEELFPEAA